MESLYTGAGDGATRTRYMDRQISYCERSALVATTDDDDDDEKGTS